MKSSIFKGSNGLPRCVEHSTVHVDSQHLRNNHALALSFLDSILTLLDGVSCPVCTPIHHRTPAQGMEVHVKEGCPLGVKIEQIRTFLIAEAGGQLSENWPANLFETNQKLRGEIADLISTAQRYQPAGSPPPGGPTVLLAWILESLASGTRPAHDSPRCPKCRKKPINGWFVINGVEYCPHADCGFLVGI